MEAASAVGTLIIPERKKVHKTMVKKGEYLRKKIILFHINPPLILLVYLTKGEKMQQKAQKYTLW